MNDFEGKVAVVTGAASGIGLAISRHACELGMQVVIADINENALQSAESDLRQTGARVLSVATDVSDAAAVEALAEASHDAFDEVHVLFNNAGIGTA